MCAAPSFYPRSPEFNKYAEELKATAAAISAPGKGILAADESSGTIGKRFSHINVRCICHSPLSCCAARRTRALESLAARNAASILGLARAYPLHYKSRQVENNQDNRRAYREMLFTTPGLGEFISGAITFEETLFDVARDGSTMLVDLLKKQAGPACTPPAPPLVWI